MPYQGITTDALLLLSENRLRDSREYYEEHKPQINALAIEPMRFIAQAAGEFVQKHDRLVSVIPTRMVSRVRRDTRFTKDKSLYRDHVWLTVGRGKNDWPFHPLFWFEIYPGRVGAGVGYWFQPPAFMEHVRQWIIDNSALFLSAVKKAERSGFLLTGDEYKKPRRTDCPPELLPFMQKKELYFLRTSDDFAAVSRDDFPQSLCNDYAKLLSLYDCLSALGDAFIAQYPNAAGDFLKPRC
ncbi:MAG: DUF2461 domain-containing protein [Oscillospiraceae bacterium]|jgi:uncharacterized protein (TIGR02453 family)|nr:DUF2461 domain-containing protein [Oscillospiraceae bacterium]